MTNKRFDNWTPPVIRDGLPTEYSWIVRCPIGFKLGNNSDIGAFTYIQAELGVTLEDEVQIGSHCSIYSVSTIDGKEGPVLVKRNARVGSHSVIMPGVTIGENAVVGAFSFVTKDVPDGAVAYGVPAKVKQK